MAPPPWTWGTLPAIETPCLPAWTVCGTSTAAGRHNNYVDANAIWQLSKSFKRSRQATVPSRITTSPQAISPAQARRDVVTLGSITHHDLPTPRCAPHLQLPPSPPVRVRLPWDILLTPKGLLSVSFLRSFGGWGAEGLLLPKRRPRSWSWRCCALHDDAEARRARDCHARATGLSDSCGRDAPLAHGRPPRRTDRGSSRWSFRLLSRYGPCDDHPLVWMKRPTDGICTSPGGDQMP